MTTAHDLLQQGIEALKAGRKAEARKLLAQVVQQDERNEMGWLWLSGTVDTDEEWRICLENVLAINPSNASARRGIEMLESRRSMQPVDTPRPMPAAVVNQAAAKDHLERGIAKWAGGYLGEAISHFQTALDINPDYAEAHYNLGQIYQEQGRLDDAIREAERALQSGYEPARDLLDELRQMPSRDTPTPLEEMNLNDARVSTGQLAQAKSLGHVNVPNGTKQDKPSADTESIEVPTSTAPLEIAQVRLLFDRCGSDVIYKNRDQIKSIAEEFVRQKQQEFRGDAYLDQIEKNAIYLREGTYALNRAIVRYLSQGEPILRPEEVADFVLQTRVLQPKQTTIHHLSFLREGCTGCPVHNDHSPYEALRQMRLSGDWSKYIDELEFCCKYFQASYVVSQLYLTAFLDNHELAGSAGQIPPHKLEEVVNAHVLLWSNLCLDNVRVLTEGLRAQEELARRSTSSDADKEASKIKAPRSSPDRPSLWERLGLARDKKRPIKTSGKAKGRASQESKTKRSSKTPSPPDPESTLAPKKPQRQDARREVWRGTQTTTPGRGYLAGVDAEFEDIIQSRTVSSNLDTSSPFDYDPWYDSSEDDELFDYDPWRDSSEDDELLPSGYRRSEYRAYGATDDDIQFWGLDQPGAPPSSAAGWAAWDVMDAMDADGDGFIDDPFDDPFF
jgi:hypothetical protein